MVEGFKEAGAGGVGGDEGNLQPVAQHHEGIDLCHFAVLFGKEVGVIPSMLDSPARSRSCECS